MKSKKKKTPDEVYRDVRNKHTSEEIAESYVFPPSEKDREAGLESFRTFRAKNEKNKIMEENDKIEPPIFKNLLKKQYHQIKDHLFVEVPKNILNKFEIHDKESTPVGLMFFAPHKFFKPGYPGIIALPNLKYEIVGKMSEQKNVEEILNVEELDEVVNFFALGKYPNELEIVILKII